MLLFVLLILSVSVQPNFASPIMDQRPVSDNSISSKSVHPNDYQPNSFKQPDDLISSETVQQVLLERRSPRSARVEMKSKLLNRLNPKFLNSKILNPSKGGDVLVEYETENAQCQLRSMFLRVDELGWRNRVLAPRAFEFSYCEGNCKPIEFSPMPLIVREDGRVKLKIYEDLLVTRCG